MNTHFHELSLLYLPLRDRMIAAGCWPTRDQCLLTYHRTGWHFDGIWCQIHDALNSLRCGLEDWLCVHRDCCPGFSKDAEDGNKWIICDAVAHTSAGPTIHHALTAAGNELLPKESK